jgi:hypothetical protein
MKDEMPRKTSWIVTKTILWTVNRAWQYFFFQSTLNLAPRHWLHIHSIGTGQLLALHHELSGMYKRAIERLPVKSFADL